MFKSPLIYINITLVLVIGLIVFSTNVSSLNLPPSVQKVANAVSHTVQQILVLGSGTSNTLAVFKGSNTLDNSDIFQGPTGNIGIGTDDPIMKLDVNGAIFSNNEIFATDYIVNAVGGKRISELFKNDVSPTVLPMSTTMSQQGGWQQITIGNKTYAIPLYDLGTVVTVNTKDKLNALFGGNPTKGYLNTYDDYRRGPTDACQRLGYPLGSTGTFSCKDRVQTQASYKGCVLWRNSACKSSQWGGPIYTPISYRTDGDAWFTQLVLPQNTYSYGYGSTASPAWCPGNKYVESIDCIQ